MRVSLQCASASTTCRIQLNPWSRADPGVSSTLQLNLFHLCHAALPWTQPQLVHDTAGYRSFSQGASNVTVSLPTAGYRRFMVRHYKVSSTQVWGPAQLQLQWSVADSSSFDTARQASRMLMVVAQHYKFEGLVFSSTACIVSNNKPASPMGCPRLDHDHIPPARMRVAS